MIRFDHVSKRYPLHAAGEKHVLTDLSFTIDRGESIGICGANGAGKSTLIRLIAGAERATSGRITREMSTSWPIGYSNCFHSSLTGADNARFISRIYNRDEHKVLIALDEFAQLGSDLYQPVHTYSAGMTARLAFGISLAIKFECYLIDEVTAAGDERFRARSREALLSRRDEATLIMTSHDPNTLKSYCRRGAVLFGGALVFFDSIEEACDVHHGLQMRPV